jgi:hypothetical protein
MKVHLLIAGWDRERSIWGCIRMGADRVYLLTPILHQAEGIESWWSLKTRKTAEEIRRKFSKFFEVRFVQVIYEDYLDCFKKIIRVLKEEKESGNKVYINISSGSHVAASAAIFAASIARCKAYYVLPQKYDEVFRKRDRFISYGGRRIVEVPLLPISSLSGVEIELLKIVKRGEKIAGPELAKEAKRIFARSSRSKINYYLRKFEDMGFVSNELKGGRLYSRITEAGKMILEALG